MIVVFQHHMSSPSIRQSIYFCRHVYFDLEYRYSSTPPVLAPPARPLRLRPQPGPLQHPEHALVVICVNVSASAVYAAWALVAIQEGFPVVEEV